MLDLDAIDADLLEAHRAWFAKEPARLSIDGYYRYKIEIGCILDANDRAIVRYIERAFPREPAQTFLEVGAGHGQLSLALALTCPEHAAIAVDIDIDRTSGAQFIFRHVLEMHSGATAHADVCHSSFPDGYSGSADWDVLIATNVINEHWGLWKAPEEEKLALTLQGRDAIIDVERWWIHRPGPEQQMHLVQEIASLGYHPEPVPVPELSKSTIWSFRR